MPTSYSANIRTLLMKGKIFRQKGFALSKSRSTRSPSTITVGSGFRNYLAGAVTHRPLQPDLMPNFDRFRISSGQGMSMNAANASILSSLARIKKATKKKSSAKKSSAKKKGNFKSLKFNF